MSDTFRFLGTGSSAGVPVIGCSCSVCRSSNSKDKRWRTSGLLEVEGKRLLIDAGPDFRDQALAGKIDDVDGLLLTHPHYDHIGGLDELRVFNHRYQKAMPCLCSEFTLDVLKRAYFYLFEDQKAKATSIAKFNFQVLEGQRGQVDFCGVPITYFTFFQGEVPVNGFRYGNFAYLSDIATYPETLMGDLAGVETLVVSALRHEPSHLHLTVDQAVAFAGQVGAKETYFVHIAHDLDHEKTNASLPNGVQLAYDRLSIAL